MEGVFGNGARVDTKSKGRDNDSVRVIKLIKVDCLMGLTVSLGVGAGLALPAALTTSTLDTHGEGRAFSQAKYTIPAMVRLSNSAAGESNFIRSFAEIWRL